MSKRGIDLTKSLASHINKIEELMLIPKAHSWVPTERLVFLFKQMLFEGTLVKGTHCSICCQPVSIILELSMQTSP